MLKGTLDDFTLPDVFRLMTFAKKTGRLDVERQAGHGSVFFREGEVYYAESSLSKVPLGQKLIRAGAITEGQLNKALDKNASTGERVGQILVNSDVVTAEQLETAVRGQIEDSVFDLLRWELGEFSWEPGVEVAPEILISVSVENLIMESSRRLDELEVLTRKIPSGDTIVAMASKPPEGAVEINITPEEWRILVLVDGIRTVAQIGAMVGLDEFGAMRTLYGLVAAGLIEVASTGAETEPAAEGESDDGAEPDDGSSEGAEDEVSFDEAQAEQPDESHDDDGDAAEVHDPEAEVVAEESFDADAELDQITAMPELDDPVVADGDGSPPEEWFQDPAVPVDSFDELTPRDVTTDEPAGDGDAFFSDLMDEVGPAPAMDGGGSEAPAPPAPRSPAMDAPSAPQPPAAESPRVDRAAVVRELAGLFGDEERPRRTPSRPGEPEAPAAEAESDQLKRVEDDDQVTKGLISRLIDGVKGL